MISTASLRRWQSLSRRERWFLAGGGFVLLGALLFLIIVDPLLDYSDRLDRQEARKLRTLAALSALRADYAVTQTQLAHLDARLTAAGATGRSLLAVLEEATGRANVRDRIASMQPQVSPAAQGYKESSVELRLEAVTWPQTLGLLLKLEEATTLTQVKRLQIRPRYDAPYLLDTTLLVSTYEREGS